MTQRRYHEHLHTHEAWEAKDCDGRYNGGSQWRLEHVPLDTIPDTPTADLAFENLILGSVAGFDDHYPCEMLLSQRTTWPDGPDDDPVIRKIIRWSQGTEEGYRQGEAQICDDPRCTPDDDRFFRDHTAEAAGY